MTLKTEQVGAGGGGGPAPIVFFLWRRQCAFLPLRVATARLRWLAGGFNGTPSPRRLTWRPATRRKTVRQQQQQQQQQKQSTAVTVRPLRAIHVDTRRSRNPIYPSNGILTVACRSLWKSNLCSFNRSPESVSGTFRDDDRPLERRGGGAVRCIDPWNFVFLSLGPETIAKCFTPNFRIFHSLSCPFSQFTSVFFSSALTDKFRASF